MTVPGDLGNMIRSVMKGARQNAQNPSPTSSADRLLVVVTLIGVAIVVAWPKDRPVPPPVERAYRLGQQVWERRSWWTD